MTRTVTRSEAEALLFEFTQGDALRKHGRGVEEAQHRIQAAYRIGDTPPRPRPLVLEILREALR